MAKRVIIKGNGRLEYFFNVMAGTQSVLGSSHVRLAGGTNQRQRELEISRQKHQQKAKITNQQL